VSGIATKALVAMPLLGSALWVLQLRNVT